MPMWSFSVAMRELERTPPSSLPRSGDRPPRCLLPLPPALSLPHARSHSNSGKRPTFVYGFAVPEDLLADLAHRARPRARMDGVQATYAGLALVRARTGAAGAFLAAGRPDRATKITRKRRASLDANAALDARTGLDAETSLSGDAEEEEEAAMAGVVPLVAVCSSAPGSYRRRPSQDALERLAALLGGVPRWWETYVPARGERVEDIVCAVVA